MHCTCQLLLAEPPPPAHRCTLMPAALHGQAVAAHLTAKVAYRRAALPAAQYRLTLLQCTSLWARLLLHSRRSCRARPRQWPKRWPKCASRGSLCPAPALLLGAAPQHCRP